MKKIILLLVIFLFDFAITFGQIDSCWDVILQHNPEFNTFNPDTVLYDTCLCNEKPWLPPFCEYVYAKQWFGIDLPNGALNIPQAPRDSIILRNWRDIDSSFTEMREGFQFIENKFSSFIIKKQDPYITDTTSLAGRTFKIKFEKYFNIDSVVYYLELINELNDVYYDMRAGDKLHPCWRMYYPHDPDHGSFNPDSVMLDTCATIDPDPDFPVLYAYKWYYVILPAGALNVPLAPRDSLIYRNWRDIDTSFNELSDGFQLVENKFSSFIMKKEHPNVTDTSSLGSRSWLIKFDEYFNIDSVVYYLKLISGLYDAFYDMRASQWAGDVDENKSSGNQSSIKIYPDPSDGNINIDITNSKYQLQEIEFYNVIYEFINKYSFIKSNENIIINIDLTFLPNGIFFLRNGTTIKKFIIFK